MNIKRSLTINQDGLILMISLWILAIISLLSISLAHRVIINLKLVKFQKDKMKCLYIAKAAIQKAINVLEDDTTPETDILNELWSRGYDAQAQGDGYIFKDEVVGDGIFTVSYIFDNTDNSSPVYLYGMSDEERKININEASIDLLAAMFNVMGQNNAEELADNIYYWIGKGPPEYSDPYYESNQIPYPPRKANLKSIEELSLVKGFRENLDLVAECERFFTVYTQDNTININTASSDVLKSVFIGFGADSALSEKLASNVINYRNGNDNEEPTDDDLTIENDAINSILQNGLNQNEILWVTNFINNPYFPFTVKANLFRIEVLAKLNTGKMQKKIFAVIDRKEQPYKFKYWHEE